MLGSTLHRTLIVLTVLAAVAASAVGSALTHEGNPGPPAAAAPLAPKEPITDLQAFNGFWNVKRIETNGEEVIPAKDLALAQISFAGKTARIAGFRVLFVRDFTFTLDMGKKPRTIDVTFLEGPHKGDTFEGIYSMNGDTLQICVRLRNIGLGRPKGFVTSSGTTLYAFVLERVKDRPLAMIPGDLSPVGATP